MARSVVVGSARISTWEHLVVVRPVGVSEARAVLDAGIARVWAQAIERSDPAKLAEALRQAAYAADGVAFSARRCETFDEHDPIG